MSNNTAFGEHAMEALRKAKIIGVRAGAEHKFTGVWVVVVGGRVFARSWNDKPTGWFRAFKRQPVGTVQVGNLEIEVRAKFPRGERVRDAVTAAYGEKYNTKASLKWANGFAEEERAQATIEFVPS